MTVSAVQIASNALLLIGHSPISSFVEPGNGARVMSALYESTLLDVLSDHYWRFATRKQDLSRLTSVPLNTYQYAFQLPAQFVMVHAVRVGNAGSTGIDYEIFEDEIYTDQPAISLDYIFRPDESAFPPYFVKLMEYRLAAEAAQAVASKSDLSNQFFQLYQKQLLKAKARDAQNRPNNIIRSSPFIAAHGGGM